MATVLMVILKGIITKMRDGLKQEIRVGDKVVWIGGKTQYAGALIYEVVKITEKRVRLGLLDKERAPSLQPKGPVVDSKDVVVVTKLLEDE